MPQQRAKHDGGMTPWTTAHLVLELKQRKPAVLASIVCDEFTMHPKH